MAKTAPQIIAHHTDPCCLQGQMIAGPLMPLDPEEVRTVKQGTNDDLVVKSGILEFLRSHIESTASPVETSLRSELHVLRKFALISATPSQARS